MDQVNDLVSSDGVGCGCNFTSTGVGHDTFNVRRTRTGGQLGVGNTAKALAQQFAQQAFHVQNAVCVQFCRPANPLRVKRKRAQRLLTECHVLASVIRWLCAFGVCFGSRGSVVNSWDVERVARSGVDDSEELVAVHWASCDHCLLDEGRQFSWNSETASRIGATSLDAVFFQNAAHFLVNITFAAISNHFGKSRTIVHLETSVHGSGRTGLADRTTGQVNCFASAKCSFDLFKTLNLCGQLVVICHHGIELALDFGCACFWCGVCHF